MTQNPTAQQDPMQRLAVRTVDPQPRRSITDRSHQLVQQARKVNELLRQILRRADAGAEVAGSDEAKAPDPPHVEWSLTALEDLQSESEGIANTILQRL